MSGKYGRLILIGLALIGASVVGNAVLYAFGVSPFNTEEIRESKSVPADGISRITINTDDGDVRVVVGGGEAITATVEGRIGRAQKDGVVLKVEERDGQVAIAASREVKRRLISFNPGEYDLVVTLPERLYDVVEVVTVAADIAVEGVRANQFVMETTGGEIRTSGLVGVGSIDARTDAGDIELGVRAIEGDIRAATAVGDIEVVTAEAPEKLALDMRTRIGERKVRLPGTAIVDANPDVPAMWLAADVGNLEVKAAER